MKKLVRTILGCVIILCFTGSCGGPETQMITEAELRDKIAGGWAGKMFGVAYGAPTEFRALGTTYDKELTWSPERVENALYQDDLYVQITYMMVMDEYGIDAPAEKFAEAIANAGYMLFHANRRARKNYWMGILPPESGQPEYNLHADDIDFQIEADFIGFMHPGMPQSSNRMADKIGHVTNFGDGVYGGMFVAALYTAAFFEEDLHEILEAGLQAIPAESQYAQVVRDVMDGYRRNPDDWRTTWEEIQQMWGVLDACGAMHPFNIDAKLNGAYIVMGLLYGEGDLQKTMEISLRGGQDSDCNPSNAAAIIGLRAGYSNLPETWTSGIPAIGDSVFIHTSYSFNEVVDRTLHYAKEIIVRNGGRIEGDQIFINVQKPKAPALEQSFPNLKPVRRTTVADSEGWEWNGDWEVIEYDSYMGPHMEVRRITDSPGSEVSLTFDGTGVVVMGHWDRDGGIAEVFVDGEFDREIDSYYWVDNAGAGEEWLNGTHLYHILNLEPGEHTVRILNTDRKNEKSTGTKLYVERAVVYTTAAG